MWNLTLHGIISLASCNVQCHSMVGWNLCLSEGMGHCSFGYPHCSIKMDLLDRFRMRSVISACYTWCKPLPQPWNITDLQWGTRIFEETTLEQFPLVFAWTQKLSRSEPQPVKAKTHWGSGRHQLHIQTPHHPTEKLLLKYFWRGQKPTE